MSTAESAVSKQFGVRRLAAAFSFPPACRRYNQCQAEHPRRASPSKSKVAKAPHSKNRCSDSDVVAMMRALIISLAVLILFGTEATRAANPTFGATKIFEPPVLDGKLDDACWKSTTPVTIFKQRGSETPAKFPSFGYVCYDQNNLYFGVRCMEPDPESIVSTTRKHRILTHEEDVNVFDDDSVEIMVKPSGASDRYFHFSISVSGSTFDALRTHGGGGIDESWNGEMTAATSIGQDHWAVEVRIPFYTLEIPPEVISRWAMNICRNKKQPSELSAIAREGEFNGTHKFAQITGLDVDFKRFCIQAGKPILVGEIKDGKASASASMSLKNYTGKDRQLKIEYVGESASGRKLLTTTKGSLAAGEQIWIKLGPVSLKFKPSDRASTYDVTNNAPTRQLVVSDADTGERLLLANLKYPAQMKMLDIDLVQPNDRETGALSEKARPMTVELTASISKTACQKGSLIIKVIREDHSEEVAARIIPHPARVSRVVLDRSTLPLGPLRLVATFQDADGQPMAKAQRTYENLPARENTGVVLNNLVTELINIKGQEPGDPDRIKFTNPRNGWVFFSTTSKGRVELTLRQNTPTVLIGHGSYRSNKSNTNEAMRWLPAGDHVLSLKLSGDASLENLVVRSIPTLMYWRYPSAGLSWEYLQKHVFGPMNTLGLAFSPAQDSESQPLIKEWENSGKLMLVGTKTRIWEYDNPVKMAADVASSPGYTDPLLGGAFQEEFSIADWPIEKYLRFAEAVKILTAEYPEKRIYAYCHSLFGPPETRAFIEALIDNGSPFTWGRYEREMPDEESARARLDPLFTEGMLGWKDFIFEAQNHIIPVLGCYNVGPESLNENPAIDFKVWLDVQMQHLATQPAFDGLAGVMLYNAKNSDEESIRWLAGLYRHYGIEGKRELLSEKYGFRYSLTHLTNPDFDNQTKEWTISPAEEGSIGTGTFKGLGRMQGRVRGSSRGDNYIRMKRNAKQPNRVSQQIKDLVPGAMYSIKMISMDYQDLMEGVSVKKDLSISLNIENVEMDPSKGLTRIYESSRGQEVGGSFSRNNQPWFNYHWRVFRAKGATANLTISDWTAADKPGDPIGQELICNFIEVQPYFPEQ
jgi:hypothetical protein